MQKFLALVFHKLAIAAAILSVGSCGYLDAATRKHSYDLIIVGEIGRAEGLGKIACTIYDSLHKALNILMIDYQNLNIRHHKTLRAKVVLCTAQKGETNEHPNFCDLLPQGDLMIAYSVLETSRAPQHWVERFNQYFDAIVVADQFLVQAYQDSGITTPIFVLPHGFGLEQCLQQPQKQAFHEPFVFGMSGAFHQARKNPELLVKAFVRAFGDRPDVKLRIHTKGPWTSFCDSLAELIKHTNASNITFEQAFMSEGEYVDFLKSLDCYVLVSAGEGYSITPREAMALGIPCILSDTTAHTTICKSGYVRGVPCTVAAPGWYPSHPVPIGTQYSPTEEAVAEALLEVYHHKDHYLELARQSRPWLEQYTDAHLAPLFVTLCQPQEVKLADQNLITEQCLITTSQKLYNKQDLRNI